MYQTNLFDDIDLSPKRVLSLFSGCGGMDLGFEGSFKTLTRSINKTMHSDWIEKEENDWILLKKTNFQTVFANDIRPDAKSAWVTYFKRFYNNAEKIYHLDSIVDLVKQHKEGNIIFPNNIDVVTGGFPCQDFSIAGKRLGLNSTKSHTGNNITDDTPTIETRGQLYMWMREVISITKPKVFIAENVKGLTNLDNVKEIIEHDFSTAANDGYIVTTGRILHSANYGVPQSRERVIFFGFRKDLLKKEAIKALQADIIPDEYNPYPMPTHNYTLSNDKLDHYVTCKEAFISLAEPDKTNDVSQMKYSKAKFMGKHCQGQIEIKLDNIAPTIRSEHHGNIEFRRLNKEHGGQHEEELNQGLLERRLTIRECARIQTFPDDYNFILPKTENLSSVNASNAYKIIGNAVPCLLAYNIAMNLQDKWALYLKE